MGGISSAPRCPVAGRPLFTAQDVAYTFNNIALNKKLGSNKASNFTAVTMVRPAGPYTVQFLPSTPWLALPSYVPSLDVS